MKKSNIILVLILSFALALRVWGIGSVPVSLFGDEVDVGYHAYSIYKTGRDYSGNILPLHLKSLADYKTPLYAYSIIPTIAIFGISPLGVRLPAALFGVLGIYFLYLLIIVIFKNKNLALLSAFLLTVSPWHIHYSRWGFEGTLMLTLFSAGLYYFLKSLDNNKWLVLSAVFFGFTPASYHSAKIFLPLILVTLFVIYFKRIRGYSRKYLILSSIIFTLITVPFVFSTLFGGGTDRFQSTSIFQDLTLEGQIGAARLIDALRRDPKAEIGSKATFSDQFFHNKITFFGAELIDNYLQSFSSEFLFIKGDPELTHAPKGGGEFYIFEAPFLILGLIFLFLRLEGRRTKFLLVSWILAAPIPSILTNGGGHHASRLLFLLPPLVILISLGIYYSYFLLGKYKYIYAVLLIGVLCLSFIFYEHNYWNHYPWDSERWWHAGFKEAIQSTILEGNKYEKVIISGADEPPLIFFLGWSQYPPSEFQKNYPLQKTSLEGIGEVSRLDKYYFTPIGKERGLYELGKILPSNSLYLATFKEIKLDLIREPNRVPSDLTLIKSISYPSGQPAFYLFTKNEQQKTI